MQGNATCFVESYKGQLHSIELHLSRYASQCSIDLMNIDKTPFLESLESLMGTGIGGTYAAYLNTTVSLAFKSAFVQNQLSMPAQIVLLVRLAVHFNPNIVPHLVYEDFKETVRCLYDLARSVSLGKLYRYVVSGL